MKVLFFGRKDCAKSKKALEFLKVNFCNVIPIWSEKIGEKIPGFLYNWEGDYIFSYRSYFILPQSLIIKAKLGAINFHPAPPTYPGSGAIVHALYNEEKEFGVTAHFIEEKIDSGKIIAVERLTIFNSDNYISLAERTHYFMLVLFYKIIEKILLNTNFLQEIKNDPIQEVWRGKVRKMIEADSLYCINSDINEKELLKIIRATNHSTKSLYIQLHGKKFILHTTTDQNTSNEDNTTDK